MVGDGRTRRRDASVCWSNQILANNTFMFSSARGCSTVLLRNLNPVSPRCSLRSMMNSLSTFSQSRNYVTEIWKNSKPSDVSVALSRTKGLYKTYKPVSPGIRHLRRPLNPHIYKGRPVRSLTVARRKNGGRNQHGVITVRHRGGGHKQQIGRASCRERVW